MATKTTKRQTKRTTTKKEEAGTASTAVAAEGPKPDFLKSMKSKNPSRVIIFDTVGMAIKGEVVSYEVAPKRSRQGSKLILRLQDYQHPNNHSYDLGEEYLVFCSKAIEDQFEGDDAIQVGDEIGLYFDRIAILKNGNTFKVIEVFRA